MDGKVEMGHGFDVGDEKGASCILVGILFAQ